MKMIRAIPRYLKAAMIEVDILRRISQEKCRLASHLDLKNEKDAEIQEDVSRSRISSSSSAMHETDSSHCIEMVDYFRYRGHICIIYPEYGLSLYEFIRKNRYRGFLPLQVRSIARQLLEAIKCVYIFFFFASRSEGVMRGAFRIAYTSRKRRSSFFVVAFVAHSVPAFFYLTFCSYLCSSFIYFGFYYYYFHL